jgi:hypothetical protein
MAEAANFSSIQSLLARVEGAPAGQSAPPPRAAAAPRAAVSPPPAAAKKKEPHVEADASSPVTPPATMAPAARLAPSAEIDSRAVGTFRASEPAAASAPPPPRANLPGSPRRVTQSDLKAAGAEPVVRAAIEVFNGRIVDVQRSPTAPPAPAAAPDSEA